MTFNAATCDLMDLVFVIDSSGSINKLDTGNWNRVLDFINKVVNRFTVGENAVHIGMVEYRLVWGYGVVG